MANEQVNRGNIAACSLCEFSVPWDRFGKVLMEAHLAEKHDVLPPYRKAGTDA